MIEQISLFLENKPGVLEEIAQVLAEKKVNTSAISIADAADFSIVRVIVGNVEKVAQLLKKKKWLSQPQKRWW